MPISPTVLKMFEFPFFSVPNKRPWVPLGKDGRNHYYIHLQFMYTLHWYCRVLSTWRLGPPFSPWVPGLKTLISRNSARGHDFVLEQLLSASWLFKLDCFWFCRLSSVLVACPSILPLGISYDMQHLLNSHWVRPPWLPLWPSSLLWLLHPPSFWQLSITTWPLLLQFPHHPLC